MIQGITATKRVQLGRKFQLAHFICITGKSFQSYETFDAFEKNYHNVDLGSSYLTDKAGAEIMKYISLGKRFKKITQPLHENIVNYYSILFDGASSEKCVDEKELFIMKTCVRGKPTFNVMSSEEPDECNADDINEAMKNSFNKLNFNFECKNKEIGVCSDGAAVNRAVYNQLIDELGPQYLSMFCPSHKFKLALNDVFQISKLNKNSEKSYTEIYYFYKPSPLRWQLFKRQSIFMELPRRKYKRFSGTRWVEHRIEALDSHLINLPILIGFCDQQISSPHNNTIKKLKSKLEGVQKSVTSVTDLTFNSVKLDVLEVFQPMSKILQETSLLSPTFLTTCTVTMENISRMSDLIENWKEKGKIKELFPGTLKVLDSLEKESANLIPDQQLRGNDETGNEMLFYGYSMKGNVQNALDKVLNEMKAILKKLKQSFSDQYDCILKDEFILASATFLDMQSFSCLEFDEILASTIKIKGCYSEQLAANGCNIDHLNAELRILYSHVNKFLSNVTPSKCWPCLFKLKEGLGIKNILHIAEICICIPLSNAECKCIFHSCGDS